MVAGKETGAMAERGGRVGCQWKKRGKRSGAEERREK